MTHTAQALCDIGIETLPAEKLAPYSSFSIGGSADLLVLPHTPAQLCAAISVLSSHGEDYRIMGRCTNILLPDEGIKGAVICTRKMRKMYKHDDYIEAEAGCSLTALIRYASCAGLEGIQKLYGIPGSVGGAVTMNSGAFGQQISDTLGFLRCYDIKQCCERIIKKEELGFSYRESLVKRYGIIVLSAVFQMSRGTPRSLLRTACLTLLRRSRTQPLEYPSAGSVFRRPTGHYASRLIEQCGLKGESVGGAEVSQKHAGFIINTGSATSDDVKALISKTESLVFKTTGVKLECEIEIW